METHKIIDVAVTLTDGTRWLGCEVFLPTGDRLSDVMNDDRKFLPIKRDGKEIVVHKDQVMFLTES